jgi:beta-N-acetylglucosaminidase
MMVMYMKQRIMQYAVLLMCLVVAVAGLTFSSVSAQSTKRIGTVTHNELRVRDGAGTDGTNTLGYLYAGNIVTILDQTTVGSTVWYKINCNISSGNITGWSSGDYIQVRELVLDGTYEEYLASQGFPESYWEGLSTLHALYPNWQFVAVETGLDWNEVVAAESRKGVKLTYRYNPEHYIDWTDVDADGNLIGRDGYYWVQASTNIIRYYLDPRNFLSDPYIFMFESQSYDVDNHTIEGVENVIGHTFMKAENTFEADGATYTHAQAIMEAAKISGVSPLHLASRLRQEQGTTGSSLSFGTVGGYEGYYNYFNYGAYPTSENTTLVNGALYAKNVSENYFGPWTNPLRAIKGGAKLLGQNYINIGQDTVYFQCFNVVYKPSLYGHQYMTNVQVGETESQTLRNAYSTEELKTSSFVFKIPVYNNMPATPCTQTGEDPSAAPTMTTGYYLTEGRISGIAPGTQLASFVANLGVQGGTAKIYNAAGALATYGTMATGDVLKIYKRDGSEYASYTVVLWGDINGDGVLTSADALGVQLHIVGRKPMSGSYKMAADANGDGSITSADALKIQLHIVQRSPINQAR